MMFQLLIRNSFSLHLSNALNTTRCNSSQNEIRKSVSTDSVCSHGLCCGYGRRQVIEAFATAFLPIPPSVAISTSPSDPNKNLDKLFILITRETGFHNSYLGRIKEEMLSRIHPPRPDWYEEFYASALDKSMKAYEAEVAVYKLQIFAKLTGEAKTVLEIGIGTGPNLKYYANEKDIHIFGVDPNKKMEKYAQKSAVAAGLPSESFEFIQGVGEALPLRNASVDAVVGTLVLCSVEDVDATLREIKRVLKKDGLYLFVEHVAAEDGTFLKLMQSLLDPLQQTVADGCHLTRNTRKSLVEAGFSNIDITKVFLSSASLINPHVYGVARK